MLERETDSNRVFIAIGSNLPDRMVHIRAGIKALDALPDTKLVVVSSIYETDPCGDHVSKDKLFLNAVAEIDTCLPPLTLMILLLEIEKANGRVRCIDSQDRTLDLDIILYGDLMIFTEILTIPHPRFTQRLFVLRPLAELAPDLVVPGMEEDIKTLLKRAESSER